MVSSTSGFEISVGSFLDTVEIRVLVLERMARKCK